jgi:probable rRNA maturation factor
VQFAAARRGLPGASALARWAREAGAACVTIRIVGAREGRRLNRTFRGKDHATNVLAFDYGASQGDVVLCVPVIRREARAQGKALAAHCAHLVVHGVLHLRGYDHARSRDRARMGAAERRILRRLGFADPYAVE